VVNLAQKPESCSKKSCCDHSILGTCSLSCLDRLRAREVGEAVENFLNVAIATTT
jgi:hypothetical protein